MAVKVVYDHLGNQFPSIVSMCKHYGVKPETYYSRIQRGWSLDKALTTQTTNSCAPMTVYRTSKIIVNKRAGTVGIQNTIFNNNTVVNNSRKVVVDHIGKEFNSIKEMCDHYGIKYGTFNSRINKGWSISDALTK